MSAAPLVLGIETSCDETGIGIVRGREVLANVIASSMEEQARYGGVVPEIAARAHLEAMTPALREALAIAGVDASPTSTPSPSPRGQGWRARSWSASAPRRRSPSPRASRSTR